jgi:curli biogenesis system outer membrane secretion channel CsgG
MREIIGVLTLLLLLSGCSQTVRMKAIVPAEIDRAASTKTIAVSRFENDSVNLSGKIEAQIAKQLLDGTPYFTIVSRNDFDRLIKEQKLQNSGLLEPSQAVDVGKLMGAEAIISGSVSKPSISDSNYYEQRSKCMDKKCKDIRYYDVRCIKRAASLWAEIRMVDVEKGDIIYADRIKKSDAWRHCMDDAAILPSRTMASQSLADEIVTAFSEKLMPHYRHFEVELLEKPDLEYTDEQEALLENALKYIDKERLGKAQELLTRLIDSTAQRSYVPFYNLGVIKEAQGAYEEAKELYERADALSMKPVDAIDTAYVRIRKVIADYEKSRAQITR